MFRWRECRHIFFLIMTKIDSNETTVQMFLDAKSGNGFQLKRKRVRPNENCGKDWRQLLPMLVRQLPLGSKGRVLQGEIAESDGFCNSGTVHFLLRDAAGDVIVVSVLGIPGICAKMTPKIFSKGRRIEVREPRQHVLRGNLAVRVDDSRDVREAFHPERESAATLRVKGCVLSRVGLHDGALDYFDLTWHHEASRRRDLAVIFSNLALVNLKLGFDLAAIWAAALATHVDDKNEKAWYRLSQALRTMPIQPTWTSDFPAKAAAVVALVAYKQHGFSSALSHFDADIQLRGEFVGSFRSMRIVMPRYIEAYDIGRASGDWRAIKEEASRLVNASPDPTCLGLAGALYFESLSLFDIGEIVNVLRARSSCYLHLGQAEFAAADLLAACCLSMSDEDLWIEYCRAEEAVGDDDTCSRDRFVAMLEFPMPALQAEVRRVLTSRPQP